jgi:hypothetical protein
MKTRATRYIFSFLLGALGAGLIWYALVAAQIGVPTEASRWVYDVITKKVQYAKTVRSPKLVVVAGSNGMFGIKTEMIEREMGIPSVNLASHAGLGVDYVLNTAKEAIKPGDTVLLPLEYEMYDDDARPSTVLVDYIFARDPAYFRSLPFTKRAELVLAVSPSRVVDGLMGRVRHRRDANGHESGPYRVEAFNDHGDEVMNLASLRTEADVAKRDLETASDAVLKGDGGNKHGWLAVEGFIGWCQANNVKVLAAYPSTVAYPEYNRPIAEKFFGRIAAFYDRLHVPVLGDPQQFMYAKSAFYDTSYHLTQEETVRNTERIIGLLRPYVRTAGVSGSAPAPRYASTPEAPRRDPQSQ